MPAGTQPGKEFVFRQRGVHRLHGRGRGDLRVRVNVQVPTKLNEFETELLDEVRRVARRVRRQRRAGVVLADQIRLLVNPVLRGSAAHVFVDVARRSRS